MAAPTKIKGRYEIRQVLGQGGMGVVYRAYDTLIKREVALKTIRDIPDRTALDLFYKECDVLASMTHPNIVEIFDIGEFEEDGASKPYFVMPLLPGVTLDSLIKDASHRLTVDRSVEIMTQTCRGLQAAHDRGLIHRDLKPSNIFVLEDDSVKIIDFGVAHMVDTRSTMGHKGTLLYMAPEQIEMKPPTPLSDIFSLGVVFYETFTGRRPFERPTTGEIAQAILHQIPPPCSDINPGVSQALSRVIHKSIAKQPWHRFSSAREFGETLQKAVRGDAIEFFDPARIQPRIQRATKAFETGDFQFAGEILSELEAEGHVDPAISMLRRQIDQSVRQKTIMQLLDSARTRFEEEEFPLALQKIQEVLQLDANNAAALSLKTSIENKRSESKIDDWYKLARQHIENHAFSHARQALQNVLQMRPKETRAQQMLAEVNRKEEEYVKARQEKEKLYQSSLEAWQNGDVSAALTGLERLLDLDRRVPDTAAPERGASYQNFYNQVRTEHDAIKNSYSEARKYLEDSNFSGALAICNELLVKHPGHALFQALKYDVEERQRQQLSSQIAEIDRQVEAEADLERRVSILKDAVERYPGESHFERSLRLMRDKRDLVNSIVGKARNYEERGQYSEALGQWEILKTIYAPYPGLNFEVERVIKRREQQARGEAKTRWVEQIDRQLETGEYSRALDLCGSALAEFPDDSELVELQKLARQGIDRAAEAQKMLAQGQELCGQGKVEEGIETLRQAQQLDERSITIRNVLLDTLLDRARTLLESDWRAADELTKQALDLDPNHTQAKSILTLASDKKREEFVNQCVAQARQLQSSGDVPGAIAVVEKGLSSYRGDSRLIQLYTTLSKSLPETRTGTRSMDRPPEEPAPPAPVQAEMTAAAPRERPRMRSSPFELPSPATRRPPSPKPPSPPGPDPEEGLATIAMVPPLEKAPAKPPEPPATPPAPEPPRAVGSPPPPEVPPTVQQAPIEPPARPPEVKTTPAPPPVQPRKVQPPPAPPRPAAAARPPAPPKPAPAKTAAPGKRPRWILPAAAAVVVVGAIIAIPKFKKTAGPPGIAVEIRTTPPGAAIKINNEDRGVSNLRLELPAGTYQIEAQLEGYQPAVSSANPAPNAPVSLDLTLQPLPSSVRLFTDVESGKVTLDDQPAGELQEGQFAIESVAPGKHVLKVTGGRGQATIEFEARPGAAPAITGPVAARELVAVLVSNLGGKAQVQSSVTPVKVTLDGQPAGEVGPNGLDLNNVAAGNHDLVLSEGKDERKVIVGASPAPSLSVFLKSDRNVGTLVVLTGEDDVKVFLNGKEQRRGTRRGQLRIPNLAVQNYAVKVAKDGFQAEGEQKVELKKGDEAKVEFHLRPVPTVASLAIKGAMPGAQVFLEGKSIGTIQPDGGFSQSNIAPGDHNIELRKEQYRPKRVAKRFNAGETVVVGGGEVAMERAIGTLRLNISPAESRVTITHAGDQPRLVTDTTLTLPEGAYTLVSRAPNYAEKTLNVQLGAGENKVVDLALVREKSAAAAPSTKAGMSDWENASFTRDGNWFVQKGGNQILFKVTPVNGTFVFTGWPRKARRLQWFVNHADEKNYVLYQLDKKFLYRNQVVNGKQTEIAKLPHTMNKAEYFTIELDVKPASVVHRLHDGEKWITLDEWVDSTRNFSAGKFGLLVPGNDQIEISNFSFTPRP